MSLSHLEADPSSDDAMAKSREVNETRVAHHCDRLKGVRLQRDVFEAAFNDMMVDKDLRAADLIAAREPALGAGSAQPAAV